MALQVQLDRIREGKGTPGMGKVLGWSWRPRRRSFWSTGRRGGYWKVFSHTPCFSYKAFICSLKFFYFGSWSQPQSL